MKKLLITGIVTIIILCGCSANSNPAGLGETTQIKNWEINIKGYEFIEEITTNTQIFRPNDKDNNIFLVLDASVKNVGEEATEFLPMLYNTESEISAAARINNTEYIPTNLLGYSSSIVATSVEPQELKDGAIIFEIPKEFKDSSHLINIQFSLGKKNVTYTVRS